MTPECDFWPQVHTCTYTWTHTENPRQTEAHIQVVIMKAQFAPKEPYKTERYKNTQEEVKFKGKSVILY